MGAEMTKPTDIGSGAEGCCCLLAAAATLHSMVCPWSLPVANKDDDGSAVHSEQQT